MKTLYSVLFLLAALNLPAQVSISATADKLSPGKYRVNLQVFPTGGCHIYAGDSAAGINGPSIDFDDIVTLKPLIIEGEETLLNDPIFNGKKLKVFRRPITISGILSFEDAAPDSIRGTLEGYAGMNENFIPLSIAFKVALPGGIAQKHSSLKLHTIDLAQPLNRCAPEESATNSILRIFFLGFLGGIVSLFTPCVFPMVPVTVSFFAHRSGSRKQGIRNGMLYGGFILSIYLAAGIPFHFISNLKPELLNNIATSAPLNLLFFAVFLLFALSFFGLFDIKLPYAIANKADSKSGMGSKTGIFFMALTLAIASFSCTGPILGSLLVGSVSGSAWPLTAGLAGFGLAFALPFSVFAIFPNLLKALPKSGGWMDTLKKILAFVELALAFKFLSNADLVMHWGILKREVFIAIWILIGVSLAVYLLSIKVSQSANRFMMLLVWSIFFFCIYLIPGLTASRYANLSLLSGIAPPLSYSIYRETSPHVEPDVINDYEKAVRIARKQNKKLLIDFTGWACVNCRKMEEQVWSKPEVRDAIKNEYILLSLYVDDKTKLPPADRSENIKTVGDKWAAFQAQNFGQVSQPLYVILDTEERLVNEPVGYTPNAKKYLEWLRCGSSETPPIANR